MKKKIRIPLNGTRGVAERYRPFLVKFHGPGVVRGSRFSIHDLRHGTRKTVGMDDSKQGLSTDQAVDYLVSTGISVDALALFDFPVNGAKTECLLLSRDFATQLK